MLGVSFGVAPSFLYVKVREAKAYLSGSSRSGADVDNCQCEFSLKHARKQRDEARPSLA